MNRRQHLLLATALVLVVGARPAAAADEAQVRDLIERSAEHVPGRVDSAATWARRAVTLARSLGEPELLVDAKLGLGHLHYRDAALDSALLHFDAALEASRRAGYDYGIGAALNRRGNVLWLQDRQAEAKAAFEAALTVHRERDDAREIGRSLNNLGIVYRAWGDYQRAVELLLSARDHYAQGDYTEGEAWLDFSLAILYKKLGDLDNALASIEASLAIYGQLAAVNGDSAGVMICYGQLGDIHTERGDPQTGLEYHRRALRLRRGTGVAPAIADGLTGVGRAYVSLGDDERALAAFEESQALRRAEGLDSGQTTNLRHIGDIRRRQGRLEQALSSYREALENARTLQDRAAESQVLAAIAAVHAEAGDYEQAWREQQAHQEAQALVMNAEVSKRIAALQVEHQVQTQAAENERLKSENRTMQLLLGAGALLVLIAVVVAVILQRKRAQIRVLKGLIPICAHCKKIRNDSGYYEKLETYIANHSEAEFSHGVCDDCAKEWYGEFLEDQEAATGGS